MKLKLFKFPILVGLILVGLGASAFAVTDVTPANSLLNPANGALYVVNNAAAQVKIYTNFEDSGQRINLPTGSTCYGLALSPANNMLYISVSAGANSKVRAYALNLTSGLPIDEPHPVIMSGDGWSIYSAAAGMAVGGNDRLFVADKGVGRFLAYNTTTNAYVKFINSQISGKSNIYGIATTTTSGSNYKIYVSRKTLEGEIYVYSYNNDTITYVKTLTGLSLPTYMKVVGDKLYVATCGSNQTALKVYSTVDETLVATINVAESVAAFFGLAGFDVSSDGATLAFTKELGSNQTRVYKLATAGISGTVTATAAAPVRPADGLALSSNAARAALSYSYTGSVEVINLANLYEPDFATELGQFKADGTTPIAAGAETNENQVVLKYRVSDRDGGSLTPSVIYRQIGGNWITVNGTPFLSGEIAQIPLSNLANGPYEWEAGASDGVHDIVYKSFGESVGTDFSVLLSAPQAINTLYAAVGTSTGEVKISWEAVSGASSYILKYSYNAPLTTDAAFNSATTYSQAWTPLAAGQRENKVLTGLTLGEKIWLSIKAVDNNAQAGALGNCAVTIVKNFVPAPVITKVYPQKGPNDRVNHIVIIGQNLYNDMLANIGTTPLLNVHQDSDTMVQADIPTGVPVGTYEIAITCPGGTYDDAAHANPNNNFQVISAGSDTQAPALVSNFQASDGQDSQSVLTWTNPADNDLREVVILRKQGSYPTAHTDAAAIQVFDTLIPEPGAAATYTDTGLINGTAYYYAVFSQDTSGNWNNTATAGSNADTGTPAAGGNPSITLTFDANRGNIFWISVPYSTSYTTASSIIADINQQNGLPADSGAMITSIGRWSGAMNPQAYETYDYLGLLGWSGTDFNVVKGEALYLNIVASPTFTLQGSHDANFAFNLPFDASRGNIFWVSLPYRGNYTDAASIVADINASAGLAADSGALVTSIGRWSGISNPQAYETYDYLGLLGWSGTNLTFQPGEGYYINISGNISSWKPAVH